MARPTYPTPACSARSKSNAMFTLDVSPGMRSRVRYVWVSSSSAAARPLKSSYASLTADLMASRAASRSRRASAASLSAPPTPRPVTSITSSIDGASDASSNMPTSAPSASRCSTPPRYRRRSSSSSRRLSSSPSSASSPSSSAASSVWSVAIGYSSRTGEASTAPPSPPNPRAAATGGSSARTDPTIEIAASAARTATRRGRARGRPPLGRGRDAMVPCGPCTRS